MTPHATPPREAAGPEAQRLRRTVPILPCTDPDGNRIVLAQWAGGGI